MRQGVHSLSCISLLIPSARHYWLITPGYHSSSGCPLYLRFDRFFLFFYFMDMLSRFVSSFTFLVISTSPVTTYDTSPMLNGPGLLILLQTLINGIKALLLFVPIPSCSHSTAIQGSTCQNPNPLPYRYSVPHFYWYNISTLCNISANNRFLLCL